MTSISVSYDHRATTYTGQGTGLTQVPRTALQTSTPNTLVINNGVGNLATVATLSPALGGTGIDTSAATGIPKITAGTWSSGTIVNADVGSGAAIARTKLANGTASHVVINDGSGQMSSEAQLSASRGGTGLNLSAVAGPAVLAVNSGVTSALAYSQLATVNSIVQRDSSGDIRVNGISSAGNLVISAPLTLGDFGHLSGLGGNVMSYASSVQTVGAVTSTLLQIATTANFTYSLRVLIAAKDVGATDSLLISYMVKVKNISNVLSISSLLNNLSTKDASLTAATSTVIASGTNIQIRVTGIAAKTINWSAEVISVSQA